MAAEIALVVPAVEVVLVAEAVDLGAAIGGTDGDAAEAVHQRFERLLAELAAGHDREIRIVREILDAVEIGNLGIEEIAHEEVLAEPHTAQLLERTHTLRLFHRLASCRGAR